MPNPSWVGGQVYLALETGTAASTRLDGPSRPTMAINAFLTTHPDLVRKPDVSFIRLGRLAGGDDPERLDKDPSRLGGRSRLAQRHRLTSSMKSWKTIKRWVCP